MADRHAVDIDRPSSVLEAQLELIDLSVARNNQLLNISGNAVVGFDATDNAANVDLRFNNPTGDPFNLRHGRALRSDVGFSRIFLTNAAQAGKTLTLLVGDKPILALTPNVLDISGSSVTLSGGTLTDIVNPVVVGTAIEDHVMSSRPTISAASVATIATVSAGDIWQFHLQAFASSMLRVGIGVADPDAFSFLLVADREYVFRIDGGSAGRALKVFNVDSTGRFVHVLAYRIK